MTATESVDRTPRELPRWERYESDPSFRRWVDSGKHAPEYTFAALVRKLSAAESSAV